MGIGLESATEAERLRYFGCYIAHKFPQYLLAFKLRKVEEATWLGEISRESQRLMKPSQEFLKHMKLIGYPSNSFHYEKTIKRAKGGCKRTSISDCGICEFAY